MRKLLLFIIVCGGGLFMTSNAVPEKPRYCVILTSCGTTHPANADLSKKQLADLAALYEETDCGTD